MKDWKPRMQKTVSHLADQLAGIRTGTISLGFIETVRADCHGNSVPIRRLGVIKQQGDRILVTPFDKADVPAVVKALGEARLNAYALNPTTLSVSIPPISAERLPGTSRSWARRPRSPSGRSDRRHASRSNSRDGDRNHESRRRPMRQ
jgi:ribosome recycling factor